MFKTAATKIAHNSTLPSLAGNKDLRPLQDLITAEKAVLVSLQKLSVDFDKASEALRTWGAGEGEDLGDTLSASTIILTHFSSALSQYANREHAVRDEMKNVRSREEALDELKRRRKSLLTKADSAEKKLNKMNPENKNLQSQTEILNRLKDEIRVMDTEIMAEEASLGDFKRLTTRAFMALKFGGLLECCQKGSIAAEYGKLVISEIPVDTTQPGLPRSMYGGHAKTEELMADALRRVNEVPFSSLSNPAEESRRFLSQPLDEYMGSAEPMFADMSPRTREWDSGGQSPMYLGTPQGLGRDNFLDAPPSPAYGTGETHGYLHQPHPQQPPAQFSRRSVDDFGVNSTSPGAGAGDSGGRFATFPAKGHRVGAGNGFTLHDNPVPRAENDEPFASSVADAMSEPSFSSEPQTMGSNGRGAPLYEAAHSSTFVPLPKSPTSALGNPWSEYGTGTSIGSHDKRLSSISDSEPQLAYMAETPEPVEGLTNRKDGSDGGMAHEDKHVHFGRTSDVDEEMRRQDYSPGNRDPPAREIFPSNRIPPPSFDAEDERALNAAAAREVSRELDALNFNPPSPSMARAPVFDHPASSSERAPSPLVPPAPPFAKRAASPMPVGADGPPYQQLHSQSSSTQLHISSSPKLDSFSSPSLQGSPMANNSPYLTPPEYPRGPGSSASAPPMNLSSSSLSGPLTPSTRTISAAAFKRPQPRLPSLDVAGGGLADTSPLAFKKRLPSSPYPQRSSALASPITPSDPLSVSRPQQRERPEPTPRNSHLEDDDQFDYISAYVNTIGSIGDDTNDHRRPEHVANGSGMGA